MSKLDKIASLIPLHEIEQGAQTQIFDNAAIPFVEKIAIMPDCHQGYDLPIGAVALVNDHISPSYVGYDIGCGMINYQIPDSSIDDLTGANRQEIFEEIKKAIPTGFDENNEIEYYTRFHSYNRELNEKVNAKLDLQWGTLGSGNHFIEIGYNACGNVFITIHSGSRRAGWEVGNWYMKVAKEEDKFYHKFLKLDSELGRNYLYDMNFMLKYALDNRLKMLKKIAKIMTCCDNFKHHGYINENHNHAMITLKGNVLHRKGATPAANAELGVIPGSMFSGVYITEGKGNQEYLCSASHGAGRKMSRSQAKKNISLAAFQSQMEGVIANVSEATLDEAPDAYKDLEYVMNAQKGIVVEVVDFVKPIINVKG